MKRKRYSVEQILATLKQAEVGVLVAEPIRHAGISEQTFIAGRNSMLGWRWTRFVRRRPRGKLPRIALATDENLDVCTAYVNGQDLHEHLAAQQIYFKHGQSNNGAAR